MKKYIVGALVVLSLCSPVVSHAQVLSPEETRVQFISVIMKKIEALMAELKAMQAAEARTLEVKKEVKVTKEKKSNKSKKVTEVKSSEPTASTSNHNLVEADLPQFTMTSCSHTASKTSDDKGIVTFICSLYVREDTDLKDIKFTYDFGGDSVLTWDSSKVERNKYISRGDQERFRITTNYEGLEPVSLKFDSLSVTDREGNSKTFEVNYQKTETWK